MLQTSLGTADGITRFNGPHTTIMWLRHCVQEIRTTWKHPCCGYPQEPRRRRIGSFASKTYGISESRPQELLQKHQDIITPEYPPRFHLRGFALHARRPYRGPILNRQRRAARLHRITVQCLSFLSLPHRTSLDKCRPYTALAIVLTV